MRTTIDIPDALFRQAKQQAAREGLTLRELVLRALRTHLGRAARGPYRFRWRTEKGRQLVPDEILHNRVALYDYLDREA
jgi:hypothetical protein